MHFLCHLTFYTKWWWTRCILFCTVDVQCSLHRRTCLRRFFVVYKQCTATKSSVYCKECTWVASTKYGGRASVVSALQTARFIACLSAAVSLFFVFTLIFLSDISTHVWTFQNNVFTLETIRTETTSFDRTSVWFGRWSGGGFHTCHFGSDQTEKSRSLDQTTWVWKHQQREWTNSVSNRALPSTTAYFYQKRNNIFSKETELLGSKTPHFLPKMAKWN